MKKLLEMEVLMVYPFPSDQEKENMVSKCWNKSQIQLKHNHERTKVIDQQVTDLIHFWNTRAKYY